MFSRCWGLRKELVCLRYWVGNMVEKVAGNNDEEVVGNGHFGGISHGKMGRV